MHADDVSDFKDFWMVFQLLTEHGAADLLVGLICNLQAGAKVCGKKAVCGRLSDVKKQGQETLQLLLIELSQMLLTLKEHLKQNFKEYDEEQIYFVIYDVCCCFKNDDIKSTAVNITSLNHPCAYTESLRQKAAATPSPLRVQNRAGISNNRNCIMINQTQL